MIFWWFKKAIEGRLSNHHFKEFFTVFFGIDYSFYDQKKIMDIGCGPRGSLEWANNTQERIGLDPLADQYIRLEGKRHKMRYVKSGSESIPFSDAYFDVISSLNSLDHVDDLSLTIKEIKRCVKKGGLFLLISDIHSFPTVAEPSNFDWDIANQFLPEFEILEERHFEGSNMYKSLRENIAFDHSNLKDRYGIIALKLRRV
jgi:ubiquinone/menaquinone biosynthesis C-methylase UbiE